MTHKSLFSISIIYRSNCRLGLSFRRKSQIGEKINFFESLLDQPEDAKLHPVQGREPSLEMQHRHQLQQRRQQQQQQQQQ